MFTPANFFKSSLAPVDAAPSVKNISTDHSHLQQRVGDVAFSVVSRYSTAIVPLYIVERRGRALLGTAALLAPQLLITASHLLEVEKGVYEIEALLDPYRFRLEPGCFRKGPGYALVFLRDQIRAIDYPQIGYEESPFGSYAMIHHAREEQAVAIGEAGGGAEALVGDYQIDIDGGKGSCGALLFKKEVAVALEVGRYTPFASLRAQIPLYQIARDELFRFHSSWISDRAKTSERFQGAIFSQKLRLREEIADIEAEGKGISGTYLSAAGNRYEYSELRKPGKGSRAIRILQGGSQTFYHIEPNPHTIPAYNKDQGALYKAAAKAFSVEKEAGRGDAKEFIFSAYKEEFTAKKM